jgi:hypothetical protein
MAYTTIDDPSAYFHVNLHSGNGTNNTDITFDANAGDFQPDWVWFKGRTSSAIDHALFDSSRGTTKILNSNNNNAENAQGASLKAFNSNGFRVGDDAGDYGVNANGRTYVTWNWKINGGTTTSVSASGSGATQVLASTHQANTTAGISIITYTGTGATATITHGLGGVPDVLLFKERSTPNNWYMYHSANTAAPETDYLVLDTTDATTDFLIWNDTAPTSTVCSLSNSGVHGNTETFVCYAFRSIQGYSKFGSYTGNGDATNGPFIYTGFKPSWIMHKRTDSADSWYMWDVKRALDSQGYVNRNDKYLQANSNGVQSTGAGFDFLSNGFRPVSTNAGYINASGGTYIYMAFAEHPFVSSKGVPTTAR